MNTKLKSLRNLLLTLSFASTYLIAFSQSPSVEKSTFGIETGFLGLWINQEARLSDQFTIRSEIGLNAGVLGGTPYEKSNFLLTPVITLEPRWYYNLNKRKANSKDVSNNSGNYFSLKTSYNPDWFSISTTENINPLSSLTITPTWGIRRNVGNHFYFETGIGVGYRHYFGSDAVNLDFKDKIDLNLHLRFGYKF